MTRTLTDLFKGLVCVDIQRKEYNADEVGEENAGCVSYILAFEHDASLTDNADLINMVIELPGASILEYDIPMWDKRTITQHIVETE